MVATMSTFKGQCQPWRTVLTFGGQYLCRFVNFCWKSVDFRWTLSSIGGYCQPMGVISKLLRLIWKCFFMAKVCTEINNC